MNSPKSINHRNFGGYTRPAKRKLTTEEIAEIEQRKVAIIRKCAAIIVNSTHEHQSAVSRYQELAKKELEYLNEKLTRNMMRAV
jgi:hypothetical protein